MTPPVEITIQFEDRITRFHESSAELQTLGFARDDKGKGIGPIGAVVGLKSGCWTEVFFITFDTPQAHGSVVRVLRFPSTAQFESWERIVGAEFADDFSGRYASSIALVWWK
jgi:hypothetical protein